MFRFADLAILRSMDTTQVRKIALVTGTSTFRGERDTSVDTPLTGFLAYSRRILGAAMKPPEPQGR